LRGQILNVKLEELADQLMGQPVLKN
jgi:hypothetical protein